MQRFRIHYSKHEGLRYTGNLDMHKVWERSLRRAKLPVAYSQGFHPQPKIQQGYPLPLGYLSTTEIVDVWLDADQIDADCLRSSLEPAIPGGIELHEIEPVNLRETPLQARSQSAEYRIVLLRPVQADDLRSGIKRLLTARALPRTRRKKNYDLRPLIEALVLEESNPPVLSMRLAAREGATGRVEEVLDELGIQFEDTRVVRTELVFTEDLKTTDITINATEE